MRINAGALASLLEADLLKARWNGVINSYPGQTSQHKAMEVISRSLLKKYLIDPSKGSPLADSRALDLFLKVNESCRTFKLDTSALPSWERVAIGEAQAFLYHFFYPSHKSPSSDRWGDHEEYILTQNAIFAGLNVGPGASIGSPETDMYSKFALSNLSSSNPALFKLYEQAIAHNPTWTAMENLRQLRMGRVIADSSRLSFVPKTAEISRTICTEPLLNMLFQKGTASVLENRLFRVLGINLKDQQFRNRRLARIGSVTGEFGTIDLSSASDSMSLSIVETMFPASVVRWLKATSCRSTILPDGRKIELHMISSMGNAFTFPLQTIFFSALVYGAYKACGLPIVRPSRQKDGNFSVFGDDIIVRSEAYNLVCSILSACGFSVNVDKSFNTGLFRESCGADYYQGYNVRGVYISKLRDVRDCYSAINRLNRWSAFHKVPLPSLIGFLRTKCRYLPVPPDEDDSAGIKVPYGLLKRPLRYHKDTGGIRYRYLTEVKRSYSVDPPFDNKRELPKGFYFNPDGLLVCFLAGSIRDGRIGLRTVRRTTVLRRRYSSRWDYIPAVPDASPDYDERWKSFVVVNLS